MSDGVSLTTSASRVARRDELFGAPALLLLYDIPHSKTDPLLRNNPLCMSNQRRALP
jgi:hypothetical protein